MQKQCSSRRGRSLLQTFGFSCNIAPQILRRSTASASTCVQQKPMMTVTATPLYHAKLKWSCMKDCGACCKIGDYDAEVLRGMLKNEKDVVEYISMIGEDGWCRHFDSATRTCSIYEDRPRFCRVSPEVFKDLYNVEEEAMDDFAISCCIDQIGEIYGTESKEVDHFAHLVGAESRVRNVDEPLTVIGHTEEHDEKSAQA